MIRRLEGNLQCNNISSSTNTATRANQLNTISFTLTKNMKLPHLVICILVHLLPITLAYTIQPGNLHYCYHHQQQQQQQQRQQLQLNRLLATPDSSDSIEPNGSSSSAAQQQQQQQQPEQPNTYVRCGKCQTAYAISENDLGTRGGRRLECSVCNHSWFQTKDRLLSLTSEFELVPLPERDVDRIQNNLLEGKSAKFMGEKKLYVGNLAFQCHEDDLFEIFGQFGDVGEVNLIRDEFGKPRGFGFVTMRTEEGGEKAIANADGLMIRGRNIAVRESNS